MEKISVQLLDEPGGEPPSTNPKKTSGSTNYANLITGNHVFCGRLCRDVFGHPKNLLDLTVKKDVSKNET